MDNLQPKQSVVQPVISNLPSVPPKQNTTPWIVLSLFLIATFLTIFAYIFIPQLINKKSTQITSSQPTPVPEQVKWQAYANEKYGYSFFYPGTWKVTNVDSDEKNLELRSVTNSDLAILTVKYLSQEEREKMKPIFCETVDNPGMCYSVQLTENSVALVDRRVKHEALIAHPNGGVILINVTDTNASTEDDIITISSTFSFPNQERILKISLCPDTWPTKQEYVTFNGVKTPIKDIDTTWVQDNCTK